MYAIKNISRIRKHKCYYKSLFLYRICVFFDKKAEYRINIVMRCDKDPWGHAWLTRNNKTFLTYNRTALPYIIEKIGENKYINFWITV